MGPNQSNNSSKTAARKNKPKSAVQQQQQQQQQQSVAAASSQRQRPWQPWNRTKKVAFDCGYGQHRTRNIIATRRLCGRSGLTDLFSFLRRRRRQQRLVVAAH
jgi:hypothetical protein